jgi:hypothetical protein
VCVKPRAINAMVIARNNESMDTPRGRFADGRDFARYADAKPALAGQDRH